MGTRAWQGLGVAAVGALMVVGCGRRTAGPVVGAPAPTAPPPTAASPTDSVAVGYGAEARRGVTGAVGTVGGQHAERDGVQRVEELLRRVPGVIITRLASGSYSVRVRGGGASLGAGAAGGEPLFVVDGMPLPVRPGALDGVPPGDIERIDVLKDAGAAAVYGAQAANGVILVRTRRSRS